jgi:valyl-tRNA synthetase
MDIRLFRELNLPYKILIDKEGKMNGRAGKYAGLSVEEARNKIVEDLEKMGLLEKVETIEQNIPICWRTKNPVEFIVTKDLYLKQIEFKDDIKKISDKISFVPPFHKSILLNWIDSISIDWAITRNRYYGTEVPLWYCKKCGYPHIPEPGQYYRPWKENPPFSRCSKCGHNEFIGDNRTFDTWVDSSISALYISKYKKDKRFFEECFPVTVRPQGIDIVRTWLYYSLLRIYLLTGKPAFKYIRLSGMGLDERGRAMHKSLGNIVLPMPILEKYGADAFRIWAASETKLGFNYRFSEAKVKAARRFVTKLWNISRFISMFPYVNEFEVEKLCNLDKQILYEINKLIGLAEDEYSSLDSFRTINTLKSFIWNTYASHYIELVKNRAYNQFGYFSELEQRSAWYTLHKSLKILLLLLHPVAPFITDFIWRKLYNEKGILHESFPEPLNVYVEPKFEDIMKFNSLIWRKKEESKLSLKDKVSRVVTSYLLEEFYRDLKVTHNINELKFSDRLSVEETVIEL